MRSVWPFRKRASAVRDAGAPEDHASRKAVPARDPDRMLFWANGLPLSELASFGGPRETSVEQVLSSLAVAVGTRGLLLDADSLHALAGHARDGTLPEFREPWMSTWKQPASRAIALAREVVDRAVNAVGMDALYESGLPMEWTSKPGKFEMAVFRGDRGLLSILSSVLRNVPHPGASTFSVSIDYVLACLGNREAMARVAERIEDLTSAWTPGAGYPELAVTSDTWKRLADSIFASEPELELFETRFSGASFPLWDPPAFASISGNSGTFRDMSPIAAEALRILAGMAANGDGYRPGPRNNRLLPAGRERDAVAIGQVDRADDVPSAEGGIRITVLSGIGGSADSEGLDAYKSLLEPMLASGPPDADFLYDALTQEFPWMDGLNRIAALAAARSARAGRCFKVNPLLVVGPAGCGKSRWVRRLATISGAAFHTETLAGISNSLSITGSERGWRSARPSLPAIAMAQTSRANPVLLVDEVDKTRSSLNGDPLEGMLPLLEVETSAIYPDRFLLGTLDASNISWVMTANSLGSLPQPLMDRLNVVHVTRPDRRHWKAAANSIVMAVASEAGFQGEGEEMEKARTEAYDVLSANGSMRSAAQAAGRIFENATWKPKPKLEIVAGTVMPPPG